MKKKDQDLLKLGGGALVLLWLAGVFAPYGYGSPLLAAGGGYAGTTAVVSSEDCAVSDDGTAQFRGANFKSILTQTGAQTADATTMTVCREGSTVPSANCSVGGTPTLCTDTVPFNPSGSTKYIAYFGPASGTAAAAGTEYHHAYTGVTAACEVVDIIDEAGKYSFSDVPGAITVLARNETHSSVASKEDAMLGSGDTLTLTAKQTTDDATIRLSPAGELGVCIHYPSANVSGWTVSSASGGSAAPVPVGETSHASASSTTTTGTTPTASCWAVPVPHTTTLSGAKAVADVGGTASFQVTPTFVASVGTNTSATVYIMDWGSILVDCSLVEGWAYPASTGMTDFGITDASFVIDFGNNQN
jgi:hypothetical protein